MFDFDFFQSAQPCSDYFVMVVDPGQAPVRQGGDRVVGILQFEQLMFEILLVELAHGPLGIYGHIIMV